MHVTKGRRTLAPLPLRIQKLNEVGLVDGKPHAFLANFKGVVPRKNVIPRPESNIRLSTTAKGCVLKVLPFLGEEQTVSGEAKGSLWSFTLPPIERGAAVWLERCQ